MNTRRGNFRIEIKSTEDYNDICNDMVTDFIDDFNERDGLTRKPTQDDYDSFGGNDISWMYTQRGMELYDRFCKRLFMLGEKHFPENELNIRSSAMLFP